MSSARKVVNTKFSEDISSLSDVCFDAATSEESLAKNGVVREDVRLTWRSWMVVLVTCFAQLAQVFVIASSGQVIAFISRDLGDADLSGWIIQAPLLMQSVLSPIVGRVSDTLDRKWLVSIPSAIGFVGAIVSATAGSMAILIGGGVLIGVTLSTISILQAIPSEILPRKYRAISNGAGFLGSAFGGIAGSLGGGAVTNMGSSGWRNIFWIQAALHGATCVSLILLYRPPQTFRSSHMTAKSLLREMDLIGSLLFVIGTTLTLLALDFVGASSWSSTRVVAPLCIGLVSLLAFGLYEWTFNEDGILISALFKKSRNLTLSLIALAVEGYLFYGAVNYVVPQIILNLGFEDNAWSIAVRQLSSSVTTIGACLPVVWYATKYKDMKTPLLVTFGIFLAATICYALITPNLSSAQIGYNILVAVGQAGPLTLLVAIIQLEVPREYLSTATGLAFSVRAIGGAFGSAILNVIIKGKLDSRYAVEVGGAAVDAGLPHSSVERLVQALPVGDVAVLSTLPGSNQDIVEAAMNASHWVYAYAYRLAWSSIIPFAVVAMLAVFFMNDVKGLMTEEIEASVEPVVHDIEKSSVI